MQILRNADTRHPHADLEQSAGFCGNEFCMSNEIIPTLFCLVEASLLPVIYKNTKFILCDFIICRKSLLTLNVSDMIHIYHSDSWVNNTAKVRLLMHLPCLTSCSFTAKTQGPKSKCTYFVPMFLQNANQEFAQCESHLAQIPQNSDDNNLAHFQPRRHRDLPGSPG